MEEEEERRWHRWWPEGERLLFRPGVPTLAELCLDYVAESFQQLEGLERLPVAVRQQVFDKLSCSQKINDMTLSLFLTDNSKGTCPFTELDFSSMKWVSTSTVMQLFNPYTLLHLNLSNCTQITDEVLQAITKESRILETLIVSNNPNITEPIKDECPCLMAIDFRDTKLQDCALCSIARLCTSLLKVDIRGCIDIRWTGLKALEMHCPSLLSLHYDYIAYPSAGSPERTKLAFTQLRELGIYWDTDYKDMIYALVHSNQGLRSLACQTHRQDGTEFDIDQLSEIPELEELQLAQCTLEGQAIASRTLRCLIAHNVSRFPAKPIVKFDCPRMTHISWIAHTTRMFPVGGNVLRGCPNLLSLAVTAYPFDSEFLGELKNHHNLQILSLSLCPMSFTKMESPSLRTLVFQNIYFQKCVINKGLTTTRLERDITIFCPTLEYLRLEGCTNHAHLKMELPSLQKADVIKPMGSHYTPMVDSIMELIENLTSCCPILKILTLQSLPKDYYSTRDLTISSSSLVKLEIIGGTYPTPRDIINCHCPQLVELCLRQSNVDNFNLDCMLRNCRKLHSLDVSECAHLTSLHQLTSLKEIRVFKANKTNIKLDCVLKMLKYCPRLQAVEYSRYHTVSAATREEAELIKMEEQLQEEVPIEIVNSSLRRLVMDSSFADLNLYTLNFSSLHTLHFSHTDMLQDHHIMQLVHHSPHIRHLSLFSCDSLRQPCLSFRELLVLNLVSCNEMAEPEIRCPALQLVDIKFCPIDGEVVTSMLMACPRLITLNLLNLNYLNGALAFVHDTLQKVAISSCERLMRLGFSLPALRQVELMALPSLTSLLFLQPAPQLLHFGLVFCQRVDPRVLQRELADKAKSPFVQLRPSPPSPLSAPWANLSTSLDNFASSLFHTSPPGPSPASSPPSLEGEQSCILS